VFLLSIIISVCVALHMSATIPATRTPISIPWRDHRLACQVDVCYDTSRAGRFSPSKQYTPSMTSCATMTTGNIGHHRFHKSLRLTETMSSYVARKACRNRAIERMRYGAGLLRYQRGRMCFRGHRSASPEGPANGRSNVLIASGVCVLRYSASSCVDRIVHLMQRQQ